VHDDRLKAEIWIMAHVRRCNGDGVPAMVVRRGDARGGTVMLKLNRLDNGCRVLSQTTDLDGNRGWLAAFKGEAVEEAKADAYIRRAIDRDPDLWVIEIELPRRLAPVRGQGDLERFPSSSAATRPDCWAGFRRVRPRAACCRSRCASPVRTRNGRRACRP